MVEQIDTFVQLVTSYLQQFGIPFGILLIILESMIPILPLGVFIAFNMMAFGGILGFIISWIATCVGCLLSYLFFSKLFSKFIIKRASKREKLDKVVKSVISINFSKLVLIVALPFTPAFLVNIACGLVKVNFKKFIAAILIGKISIVYFWGFVGSSLVECLTNPLVLIKVLLMVGVAYILSVIINKKFNLDERF